MSNSRHRGRGARRSDIRGIHGSDDARAAEGGRRAVGAHRGAFGEFGGDSSGLIDRAFRERIVLVGMVRPDGDAAATDASLDELSLLVDTAGADAVERVCQRRAAPDSATFVGVGKAREIRAVAEEVDCDTVVFDDELSPAQQFNLERILGRTALDRTAVILDIFAQNARTPEGKAQVELAQLRYLLPRLRGAGSRLSQQAGGIGTRGPGETQLEVDRRRLERRIHKLEGDLRRIAGHRRTQSKARSRTRNRSAAIVGYTNAGKSSLLNRLTAAGAAVEDRLFATVDPTTRRLELPGGETVYLTDTVGFVRKLPHHLVEAFKTTLDVVRDADLLVHVVDGAGPDPDGAMAAVRRVLTAIEADCIAELVVFNKRDLGPGAERLAQRVEGSVAVSAQTGEGIDELLGVIGDRLRQTAREVELVVPWDRGDVLAGVHREGQVIESEVTEEGMRIRARLDPGSVGALRPYLVNATRALDDSGAHAGSHDQRRSQ
ncbi:MAG: GTPase HflX [Acidimicrobiaceae bacterium]|nr:GTPase HflX [Acidimicrobiaceae bacterium]